MFDTASCEWFLAKLDPYGTYNQQILDPIIPLQLLDVFNEIPQITWVKSGVLQGAVLVPLLFLLFINNFPDQAFPSTIHFFTNLKSDDMKNLLQVEIPEGIFLNWSNHVAKQIEGTVVSYIEL